MSDQFSLFDENLEPPGAGAAKPVVPAATAGEAAAASPPIAPSETDDDLEPTQFAPLTAEEKADLLTEVRQPALSCTRCALSRTRTNVVFGEGSASAPLVFVGEGPGENEDATGRPFVGRAGKLLDDVLLRNGMTRSHVYICNTVKCRASNAEAGRRVNRPPTADEISACQPWLEEQLQIIKPTVIVCLGAPAANTVIHRGFRMTSERGRWFSSSVYAPWAMAVFHPAYILRLQGPAYDAALETLIQDIATARQKVIDVKRELKEAAANSVPPVQARTLFD